MKLTEANRKFAQGINALWDFSKKGELDEYGIKRGFTHFLIVGGLPCLFFYDNEIVMMASLGVGAVSAAHAWNAEYKQKTSDTYGDARFAEYKELKKAGFTGKTGLLFGKIDGKFIAKPEKVEGHVLVIGPPGTGKTSGFVIPSLWRWKDSALVFDPKGGELAKKTAVFRARSQRVYIFNPFDEKCDRYNPVEHCKTTNEALSMAQVLIPSESKEHAFWTESSRAIVAAAIYEGHLKGKTLTDVCKFVCLHDVETLKDYYLNHPDEKVRLLAAPLRHLEDKVMASVMSDLMRNLNVIAQDDAIKRATNRSDWDLDELENRASIYLSVPEEKLKLPQYRKLLNIIINQAVDHLSSRQEVKEDDDRPRILFMIDELPTLGYIPSLLQSLATLRSRGVVLSLAFQSVSQLDQIYKTTGRKTIMDICPFKLVFGIEDPETQRYFTNRIGNKTIKTKSISRNYEDDRYNVTEGETGQPLIRSNEWANLEKPILLTPLKYPVEVDKIKYFDDSQLKRMLRIELIRSKRRQELQESVLELQEEIVGFTEEQQEAEESAERREVK
jgi:type IV secretion system protein VirD4